MSAVQAVVGTVGGFPVFFGEIVPARKWATQIVAQLISADPSASEQRKERISKFSEAAIRTMEPFFAEPKLTNAKPAAEALQRLFEKTEWAPLFHVPGRADEVNFLLEQHLVNAAAEQRSF